MINLCELLKGHEGETFYSPLLGNVTIYSVEETRILVDAPLYEKVSFNENGCFYAFPKSECMLFPSKDQRDWNKWAQKPKVPKTWNEIADNSIANKSANIMYKSVLAFMKIYQLIEAGYGGIPTKEERFTSNNPVYIVTYIEHQLQHIKAYYCIEPVAFHTEEQCNEFLSYPENIQLLKDFYMV